MTLIQWLCLAGVLLVVWLVGAGIYFDATHECVRSHKYIVAEQTVWISNGGGQPSFPIIEPAHEATWCDEWRPLAERR